MSAPVQRGICLSRLSDMQTSMKIKFGTKTVSASTQNMQNLRVPLIVVSQQLLTF